MRRTLIAAAVAVVLFAGQAQAYTWYVSGTGSDSNDGYSWSTPFRKVLKAMDSLAATNAVEGFNGGHLILVTNGTYSGPRDFVIGHSGAVGAPNVLRGVGPVADIALIPGPGGIGSYDAMSFGLNGLMTTNITVESVTISGGYEQMKLYACTNIIVRNIVFRNSGLSMENVDAYSGACADFTNCIFNFAGGGSFFLNNSGTINIKNSVFLGNHRWGIYQYNTADRTLIANCLIYANNGPGMHVYTGSGYVDYSTHAEISTDRYFDYGGGKYLAITNCIAKNPGWANQMGYYSFNAFYDNSPCLNAAEGGVGHHIGVSQNPTIVTLPGTPQTYYVAKDGDNSDGLSWTTAWTAIGTAAGTAVAGDTVLVGAGTYSENVLINNGGSDGLTLTYQAQGRVEIQGSYPLTMYGVSHVTMDGFILEGTLYGLRTDFCFHNSFLNMEFSGGTAAESYAGLNVITIMCSNGFSRCDFRDSGSGLYSYGMQYGAGWNAFRDCRFFNNSYVSGVAGGAMVRSAGNSFERCQFFANAVNGLWTSNNNNDRTRVYNCLSYSNQIGFQAAYPMELQNCTVYGCTSNGIMSWNIDNTIGNTIIAGNAYYGMAEYATTHDIYAKNCLFWDNGSALGVTTNHYFDTDGATYQVFGTAADIDGLPGCSGTVVGDPVFVNTAANDYRLRPASAAIDQGDPSLVDAAYFPDQTTDYYGNPRIKGAALDIGFHEWQPWAGTVILVR